ncbi:hypothetical protein SAMN05660816_04944 [Niastella yeongjuensis]|nr:hypothetical protein SAMN05660816_04944 [Niastella yeongjuensis]
MNGRTMEDEWKMNGGWMKFEQRNSDSRPRERIEGSLTNKYYFLFYMYYNLHVAVKKWYF